MLCMGWRDQCSTTIVIRLYFCFLHRIVGLDNWLICTVIFVLPKITKIHCLKSLKCKKKEDWFSYSTITLSLQVMHWSGTSRLSFGGVVWVIIINHILKIWTYDKRVQANFFPTFYRLNDSPIKQGTVDCLTLKTVINWVFKKCVLKKYYV